MRRLFSTFVYGRIGAALLIMRLVASVALVDQGIEGLRVPPQAGIGAVPVLAILGGMLLLVGVWTPIVGTLVAGLELWRAWSQSATPWTAVLVATIGAALALLGPGVWSIDARLFGWRRIEIPDRRHGPPPSSEP